MAILIKIFLWVVLALCLAGFVWGAYDLVWRDKDRGWRVADLCMMAMSQSLAVKVLSWLF